MATTYRPSTEAETALERLVARTGMSKQQVIDRAVQNMYEADTLERDVISALEEVDVEWADVLARLA